MILLMSFMKGSSTGNSLQGMHGQYNEKPQKNLPAHSASTNGEDRVHSKPRNRRNALGNFWLLSRHADAIRPRLYRTSIVEFGKLADETAAKP